MIRTRRNRRTAAIRNMVAETTLDVHDFIYPLFIVEGEGVRREIPSLKDCFHLSVDQLGDEIQALKSLGITACILFGVVSNKDAIGSSAYDPKGVVQNAIRMIKKTDPDFIVIADCCLCEYTDHGHCGMVDEHGEVQNDATLEILNRVALSYARAGVDMVAPSDMMDGRIESIRQALDEGGFTGVGLISYSAKYASAFYGPFREAAGSAPGFGDRKSYQMDYRNRREAKREVLADVSEGADMIMIKPAMAYLDIIREARALTELPLLAYQVSGEYAMLVHAVDQQIMSEQVIEESLYAIKRAGADMIITYFAKRLAQKWRNHE